MTFLKQAIFQRIFFTIGFGFLFLLTLKMAPLLMRGVQSFSYLHYECEIRKVEWIVKGDSRKLVLEFIYIYEGKFYASQQYMWGLELFTNQNREGAHEFSKRVSVGQKHGCYVDQKNPAFAVINPGFALARYELWTLIIFLLFFGTGFFISFIFPKEAEKFFMPSDPS